ncbi:MAG: hypothetical protein HC854_18135 [Flavobacterium sp.]|nr:hypothetical protein [Flavobacterium sp.]
MQHFLILLLTASCTTDSYDKDMDNSTIQTNENTDSTDPIIIPKKTNLNIT